jgi:uncharacterized protein
MITKEAAIALLQNYVRHESMIRHSKASGAVMRALASRLGQDQNAWEVAGLLHDIDVEITHADPKVHGLKSGMILKGVVPDEIIDAILHHNEDAEGVGPRSTMLHHALAAGETITGLIMATAMVYPDKKLASVKSKSIVKRMKEKAFAASVKRENIMECELIGISMPLFAEIALQAMQEISDELGL